MAEPFDSIRAETVPWMIAERTFTVAKFKKRFPQFPDASLTRQLYVWRQNGWVLPNKRTSPAKWEVQGEAAEVGLNKDKVYSINRKIRAGTYNPDGVSELPVDAGTDEFGNPFDVARAAMKPRLPAVLMDFLALPNPDVNTPTTQGKAGALFDLPPQFDALCDQDVALWGHPDAPLVDPDYLWPDVTAPALTQLRRGRNVALFGDKGTGKTSWAEQLAAKLQRPFTLISGDGNLEANELVGMTVPWDTGNGSHWQDGQLAAAIRVPGMVICLDEPSICRPSVLFVFQNVLQNRVLTIRETGEIVKVAPGVLFLTTDNTNGRGGGNRRGYTDTNRLNSATIDRFGAWLEVTFLPEEKETKAIASRTGAPEKLCNGLVKAANLTRQAAQRGELSESLSPRRLIAWAELLMDGIPAETAFKAAILNSLNEVDQVPMRQQCSLMINDAEIARLVKG